jgi:hypothetical protein
MSTRGPDPGRAARHPRAATGPGTRRRRHAGRGRVWSTRAGGPAVAAVSPATGHTSDCGGRRAAPRACPDLRPSQRCAGPLTIPDSRDPHMS